MELGSGWESGIPRWIVAGAGEGMMAAADRTHALKESA
jgi:hypothetical protein